MRNTYIAIMAAAIAGTATAQQLENEVVIDREIVPVERPVNRPTWVNPGILTPKVEMKRLSLNEYADVARITRSLPPLEAAAWADSVMRTPYRGYAAIGYFPVYNLGASAGYRFLDTERVTLDANIAYEGASWNGESGSTGHYSQHRIGLDANTAVRFAPGTLTAAFDYTFSATGTADYSGYYSRGNQAANMVNLGLGWTPAHTGRFGWNLGFKLGYTGFADSKDMELVHVPSDMLYDPVNDLTLGLESDLSLNLGAGNSIVLGVSGQMRHLNMLRSMYPMAAYSETYDKDYGFFGTQELGSQNMGIITLRPGYRFGGRTFSARLGVRLDFNAGGLDHDMRVAPDIDLQWSPSSVFSVYGRATGGEVMNSNSQLWQRNPWMTGVFSTERSHVNADVELGLTFGSFHGFWATVHGGWTSVADWLHPVVAAGVNTWAAASSYSGFNYGLELGYSWRDKVTVIGHVNGAQHGDYYRWEDNAKWTFDIAAKVRPISQLTLQAGYEARVDRFGYVLDVVPLQAPTAMVTSSTWHLGDTSNLFVGADYEITPALTAFVKAENLLNRHWDITAGILSRGVHGLFGVQYKF